MNQKKESLRQQLIATRRAVTSAEAQGASHQIVAQLPHVMDWSGVRNVHLYHDIASLGEVPTGPIVDWLQQHFPDITIDYADMSPRAPLPTARYDVIFAPVLGFDRGGFRLGMGGGWYDRWLAVQPQARKIGLAYTWAEQPELPREAHDIAMDMIIAG